MWREFSLADPRARRALDELHDANPNFARLPNRTAHGGTRWHFDEYLQPLPPERPGPPEPHGSWAVAQRLMTDYEFADPDLVRAVYYPDRPLEHRDMLLEGHFLFLRFHFGVRIAGVRDESIEVNGRPVQVWGWSYLTLQGHLEMGEMTYELWKWLDTGTVEFRIHVVSRAADIRNPVIRLGFRIFGRPMQVHFARRACQRMLRLTRLRQTGAGVADSGERSVLTGVRVRPASAQGKVSARLAATGEQ